MSSILVANSNEDSAKKIAAVLRSGGFNVSGVCTSGSQVINFTNRHYQGGVVVCSERLKDMPALSLLRMVNSNYDFVFLMRSIPDVVPESQIFTSLLFPINRIELIATVNMLLDLSGVSSLSVKKKLASGTLNEIEVIESAKHVLMERNHLTEAQAHRFIQKKSMDNGRKMVETALMILNQ